MNPIDYTIIQGAEWVASMNARLDRIDAEASDLAVGVTKLKDLHDEKDASKRIYRPKKADMEQAPSTPVSHRMISASDYATSNAAGA